MFIRNAFANLGRSRGHIIVSKPACHILVSTMSTRPKRKSQPIADASEPKKRKTQSDEELAKETPESDCLSGSGPQLGAHVSITGGFEKAVSRTLGIGGTAFQIFTKSNKSWNAKEIDDDNVARFSAELSSSHIKPENIMVHASYLINLASGDETVRNKSIAALTEELRRCHKLGIINLVLHPGSATSGNLDEAISRISASVSDIFDKLVEEYGDAFKTLILFETSAGQGNSVGVSFLELAKMRSDVAKAHQNRIGFCLDTCHMFSAGIYDISKRSGFESLLSDYKKIVGDVSLIKAIHLNNSKSPFGARVDRHEKIAKGHLPLDTFRWFLNEPSLRHVPMVLETPADDPEAEYAEEISLLRSLLSSR